MHIIRIICFWYYSRVIIRLSLFTVLEFFRTCMFFKKLKLHTPEYSYALKNTLAKFKLNSKSYTAVFRERFSEKAHATIPKGIVDGFKVHCSSKNFERMARQAIDLCLRVLKESNKSRFDSYSVRNSVMIIYHIAFRDCRVHIFSDNLSRNRWCYDP